MSEFGLKEAFDVYSKHRDVILQMWSFYSVSTLAVLGYTIGSEKAKRTCWEVFAILVGYISLAVGNGFAVVTSQYELDAMAKGIEKLLEGDPMAKYYSVGVINPRLFIWFYAVVSIVVCVAIVLKYAHAWRNPIFNQATGAGDH
jgi:hypothetical protein